MTIRVLDESEISEEGHRLRAELERQSKAIVEGNKLAREHERRGPGIAEAMGRAREQLREQLRGAPAEER